MKDLVIGLSLFGMVSACSPAPQTKDNVEEDYCQYVNPFIGNADNGHTFPGACAPFGLIQASPESGVGSWRYCSGYNYEDNLSLIHISEPTRLLNGLSGLGRHPAVPVQRRYKRQYL